MPRGKRLPGDKRNTAAWQALRLRVLAEEPDCQLRLPGCTGKSTTVDHRIPVSVQPALCLIRANCRGACAHCNYSRSSRTLEQARAGGRKAKKKMFDPAKALEAAQQTMDAFAEAEARARRRPDPFDDGPGWFPVR